MKWIANKEPEIEIVKNLEATLKIPYIIAYLLAQRGISTFDEARLYFKPQWTDLHDPWLMKDMHKAVDRVLTALEAEETIMIYGDYDVDGTTSVALVYDFLKNKTHRLITYIPDRYTEGYGVSFKGIDVAKENNCSLIIALDCGIKSIDKVEYANQKNIDFIICDHHLPGADVPNAYAILNPKQKDCEYPYKELCGCGIGFKFIQAINQKLDGTNDSLIPYLDLVATAIGADIVSMKGENRILAKLGMEVINSQPRMGIKTLLKNRKKQQFSITDVVFFVAPRINAAGRIDHGKHAVRLLTVTDEQEAEQIAQEIEVFNTERKTLDQSATQEALNQIVENGDVSKKATVVYHEQWHKGVVGIVASRLIETYYRPTIVFTKSGDVLAASARSIKGFDMYEALEQCSQHLIQFGGHMFAAGMTCEEQKYADFKLAFENYVAQHLDSSLLEPFVDYDMTIQLQDINPKLMRLIKQMEPFGPDNMAPVFRTNSVYDTGYAKTLGDNDHIKAFIKSSEVNGFGAVGFGLGHLYDVVKDRKIFDMVYSLEENEWNNQVNIQLKLRDLK